MSEAAKGLQRLLALRCRMADAAASDRKRIAQQDRAAEQAIAGLLQGVNDMLCTAKRLEPAWAERQALLHVASAHTEQMLARRDELAEAAKKAAMVERAAIQAREQMSRMLERIETAQARERAQREQSVLDDLFATARVRAGMTMAF